jgi:hypothetical protein
MTATDPGIDEAVMKYAAEQGITEVLHFTTARGLVGILAKGAVLSRDRLETDNYIAYIYLRNCADRLKDAEWTDHVNLSISRVNGRMLGVSERWHRTDDVSWAVLAFGLELLAHPGVYFTTTNNTYPCVKRGTGVDGLRALFAPVVEWGHYGSKKVRLPRTPSRYTTDPQAEVLYPGLVNLSHLRRIYVREPDQIDYVRSLFAGLPNVARVEVVHKPEVFQ